MCLLRKGIDCSNEKISLSKSTDEDQALSSEKIKLIVALQGDWSLVWKVTQPSSPASSFVRILHDSSVQSPKDKFENRDIFACDACNAISVKCKNWASIYYCLDVLLGIIRKGIWIRTNEYTHHPEHLLVSKPALLTFTLLHFCPLFYDLTHTWKSWPNIKTNINSSKVERAAVCAIFSSLQAISKKISAIKSCEITRWEKR